MAGRVGFEPTNAGSKGPCLTAWRPPIFQHFTKDAKTIKNFRKRNINHEVLQCGNSNIACSRGNAKVRF